MDALVGMMMKGTAKCDKHIEQQSSENVLRHESVLCLQAILQAYLLQCLFVLHEQH